MIVAPNIHAAVNELNVRLLPAKLNQTSSKNLAVVLGWLSEQNIDQSVPVKTVADFLESKVKAALFAKELVWDIEPKALAAEKDLMGRTKLKSAAQSENEFAAKKAEGERLDAQKKADEDSQRQIEELISNFQLIDHRRQQIAHGRTEQAKTNLRTYVANAKALGESLQVIAKTVAEKIADVYAADERDRVRV